MNFAMLGVGGFIAPRHLKAIKDLGHDLVACMDPSDSVGIIDSYFPNAEFFTGFEAFARYCETCKGGDKRIDFLTVCTPNYLHHNHSLFGLRLGANVICEKPLVINPKNLDTLSLEQDVSKKKVYPVLQLRYHPSVLKLKRVVDLSNERHQVHVTYTTPRGKWYYRSWKNVPEKSGGLITNIGVHLLDMLLWVFGDWHGFDLENKNPVRTNGRLWLKKADVSFDISINQDAQRQRSMSVDGRVIDFTHGFDTLHEEVYRHALNDTGYNIYDASPAILLAAKLR